MKNPCVKTGCVALVGGQIWRGDLFDLGDYYFLNCSVGPHFVSPEGMVFHLQAWTWQSTHQEDKVVLIGKRDVQWFNYGGHLLDADARIVVA